MVRSLEDIKNINDVRELLEQQNYIANDEVLFTVLSAIRLQCPILVEGPPGVGKTELSKALAEALGIELLRVQCFEGIDFSRVLYEYDYGKQMMTVTAVRDVIKDHMKDLDINEAIKKISKEINFFDKDFLTERPLLKSINSSERKLLVLDEVDKSDEEFEALLLELLSDYSISIPEYKTITCDEDKKPIVILTSNGQRELSDALKRRCLYLYIDYPSNEIVSRIINVKAGVNIDFAKKVAEKVQQIRELGLKQKPSISESIVWAKSILDYIGEGAFDKDNKELLNSTLGILLKNRADINEVKNKGF